MPDTAPLRADARRNRQKILSSAQVTFANEGVHASLDRIAEDAGVGSGTLYRHFPTREALIEAVFVDRVAEVVETLEDAQRCDDPWLALTDWVLGICRALADDRGYADVVAIGELGRDLGGLVGRADKGMTELVERAVACGALRSDFTVDDVVALLLAVAGIAHRAHTNTRAAVERFVALALEGYRAEGARPAPPPVRVFPAFGRDGAASRARVRSTS